MDSHEPSHIPTSPSTTQLLSIVSFLCLTCCVVPGRGVKGRGRDMIDEGWMLHCCGGGNLFKGYT